MVKLRGLDVLGYEIIALISRGSIETISQVEKELDEGNLVTYLNRKYRGDFMPNFEDGTYDIEELNKFFLDFSGYVQGNESRKYGIVREDDGLLLVLALVMNGLKLPVEKD